MKHLAILGSTGSIGKSALSVIATHPDEFSVAGIAANTSVDLMERQVRKFAQVVPLFATRSPQMSYEGEFET